MAVGMFPPSHDERISYAENGHKLGSLELQQQQKNVDDDGRPCRTGTVWTASAHVVTAVIGSGVLSLAWSMAQIGWIAGPVVLLIFAAITFFTSLLLTDCYRSPDPVTGKRNYRYKDAVKANLGEIQLWCCALVQYSNLMGTAIGYTITASISMVAINRSDCFHAKGHNGACNTSNNLYMALFGVVQLMLSQIPNFHKLWWLSIVAAVMSFSYSGIGLGLGISKIIENGHLLGSATGVPIGLTLGSVTPAKKVWRVFQALGNIAFAYSFSTVLIEIQVTPTSNHRKSKCPRAHSLSPLFENSQDTIKSPPAENKTMKKATLIGIITTTTFYLSVGCFGYGAFGNGARGNLLTGFGFYDPYWLVDFANACIVVHLVGAYQVFSQPLFEFVESTAANKWPKSGCIHTEHAIRIPFVGTWRVNVFRLLWRTMYVIFTTIAAMLLPFFNDIVGLIGAAGFWPLTVYFPIEMFIKQKRIESWSWSWVALKTISAACLMISIAAGIGSIEGILHSLEKYTPFKTTY
ncbi:amino acid permease 4 isoform X1 [Selaginella moellendorffii]|uniref:amino acid permease 4 isoform X1 n=1 Tax=Selaginella moellendorffii TaxID=88036 RepID=UPI000D1D077C|nr:amino acid permease 4 isoform X1 [Selaginella moellendorffii]|eukprot:XP_024535599.1 amino acid permease 4 isoform X1 [Selaginella moellendorffii]